MTEEKARENRVRRHLERWGYRLSRSRRALSLDNFGKYNVYHIRSGDSVLGTGKYDVSMEDIEKWLAENGGDGSDGPVLHPHQTGERALQAYERAHAMTMALLDGDPTNKPEGAIGPDRIRRPGATEEALLGELDAVVQLGQATQWYRGDSAIRDRMRIRFAQGCRDLATELLDYASSLSFQHYDLPDKVRTLYGAAPLALALDDE